MVPAESERACVSLMELKTSMDPSGEFCSFSLYGRFFCPTSIGLLKPPNLFPLCSYRQRKISSHVATLTCKNQAQSDTKIQ